jgi:hypothetical protein
MAAEKHCRRLRLPELGRRSYPKKTPPVRISDELADPGNRRLKALKAENANYHDVTSALKADIRTGQSAT